MAADASGAGPAPADPTAQIDQNMQNVQEFQNASQARLSMWQAILAVDEKGWKVLQTVINDVKQ
jgi:hypothetical protein